jgi:hypothetical protein
MNQRTANSPYSSNPNVYWGPPKQRPFVNKNKRPYKPTHQKISGRLMAAIRSTGDVGCTVPQLLKTFEEFCLPLELREAFTALHAQNRVRVTTEGRILAC